MLQERYIEERVQPGAVADRHPEVAAILSGTHPPLELLPQQPRTQVPRGNRTRRCHRDRVVGQQSAVPADAGQPAAGVQERLCPVRTVGAAENAAGCSSRKRARPRRLQGPVAAGFVAFVPAEGGQETKLQPEPAVAGVRPAAAGDRRRKQPDELAS